MMEAIKQNRRRNKLIKKRVISCRSKKLNEQYLKFISSIIL